MSTTYLLSTHSSNPLEAPPSDARNRAFVRKYESTKAQPDIESDSSEDEKRRSGEGTVKAYHSHIADLYPKMHGSLKGRGEEWTWDELDVAPSASTSRGSILGKLDLKGKGRALPQPLSRDKDGPAPGFVDLDEDMSDEGVPGVGECQVILNEEDDDGHAVSQDPAGSGGEEEPEGEPDINVNGNEEGEQGQEDDLEVDLDSERLDSAGSSSSSAHMPSSSLSLLIKPPDEQHDIQVEMSDLEQAVPLLSTNYRLVDRLGSGTFSSVYKAIDLSYEKYDNSTWERAGRLHTATAPFVIQPPSGAEGERREFVFEGQKTSGRVYVAVKRIYVTSGPERVRNELSIMEDCLGCRHTSQLITAFRHRDQVVAIMPYCRNEDFRVRRFSIRTYCRLCQCCTHTTRLDS
jgi:cell division control protein 7